MNVTRHLGALLGVMLCAACGTSVTEKLLPLSAPNGAAVTMRRPERVSLTQDSTAEPNAPEYETVTGKLTRNAVLTPRMRAAVLAGLANADASGNALTLDVQARSAVPLGTTVTLTASAEQCVTRFEANVFASIPRTCVPELLRRVPLLTTSTTPVSVESSATSVDLSVVFAPGSPEGLYELLQTQLAIPDQATFLAVEGTLRANPAPGLPASLVVMLTLVADLNGDGVMQVDEKITRALPTQKDMPGSDWLDPEFATRMVAAARGKTVAVTFVVGAKASEAIADDASLGVQFAQNLSLKVRTN